MNLLQNQKNKYEIKKINIHNIKPDEKKELIQLMLELDSTQDKYDKYVKQYNSIGSPEDKFNEMIMMQPELYVLIENETHKYVGFITLHLNGAFKVAHLSLFYIRPEYQHQGLGSYFLTEIESMLKEKHHIKLLATSSLKNNKIANELYKKMGFKVTGINYMKDL